MVVETADMATISALELEALRIQLFDEVRRSWQKWAVSKHVRTPGRSE
jgi:hypothetical protein